MKLEESGWKCEKVTEETEESFIERIKCLRDKYSIDGVSETAKLVIIKAIGLSKGHWYKCLNGHYIMRLASVGEPLKQGSVPSVMQLLEE